MAVTFSAVASDAYPAPGGPVVITLGFSTDTGESAADLGFGGGSDYTDGTLRHRTRAIVSGTPGAWSSWTGPLAWTISGFPAFYDPAPWPSTTTYEVEVEFNASAVTGLKSIVAGAQASTSYAQTFTGIIDIGGTPPVIPDPDDPSDFTVSFVNFVSDETVLSLLTGGGEAALYAYLDSLTPLDEVVIGTMYTALLSIVWTNDVPEGSPAVISWESGFGGSVTFPLTLGFPLISGAEIPFGETQADGSRTVFVVHFTPVAPPVDHARMWITTTDESLDEDIVYFGEGFVDIVDVVTPPDPPDPGQTPALGPINMDVPLLEFEPARAAHVWMKPQRTNMVANPSFEVGTEGEGNAATVAFSRLAHGDAGGDPEVTVDLTAGTFGMGTFGSGTFGDPGELDADVWMVAFNAAGANPKNYDLLADPWFTFRSDGWVVGLTTVQPDAVEIRSLAEGIEKTGAATGTEPIGEWDLYYFGLKGVDLTGDDSLTVVNESEFNTGIVGFGFWTNVDGGTSVSSAPFLPQAGAHTDGQFVVQIAGRWLPGAATNMEVRLDNTDVWSVGGLPDPMTPGNEYSITEIMSFEFLSTPLTVAFGWRTDGDISVVHSGTLSNPGPTPIGPAPRTKTAHLTGGTEVEYVPAYTTVDDEGDPVEVPAIMGNRIVLESNMFPTAVSQDQFMSLEAQVAGEGQVRIGLVTWNPAKLIPTYTAGPWVLLNSATAFQPVQALIALPDQADEATFRLEFRGDECWVDNVLVDNNAAQLGYFDGSWHTGRDGDFSWYGQWGYTGAIDGTVNPTEALHNIKHRSYSLYYNDRDNTDAWLFGYTEPRPKEGKLYELSPYAEVDAPVVWIDENASIEEGRQALIDNGTAGGTLGITRQVPDELAPGQLVAEELGQLSLAALTTMTRVGGEAWGWVPEGADVIPQWDDVYGLRVPCWPGELFVPVKDVSGMPVTQL